MAEKMTKKNSPVNMTLDLFVKLGNLYDDCYFLSRGTHVYVIPKVPAERIYADLLCDLTSVYVDALKPFFDNALPMCLYMDVDTTKKWLKELTELVPNEEIKSDVKTYMKEINDESVIKEITEYAFTIENKFIPSDGEIKWMCLGDDAELVEQIFDKKMIVEIPISRLSGGDDKNLLTLSKEVIPMVTNKTVDKCFLACPGYGADETVLDVLLWYNFTHFNMMLLYVVVTLPWDDDND